MTASIPPRQNRSTGRATIYDIAKLAGVSPSAVSRALSTPGRISKVTEAKIRAAAKTLNYQVNPHARALPTGKTRLIALTISDITNPVFFRLIRGAEKLAAEHGYILVVSESQESESLEEKSLERLMPLVDGVILATTRLTNLQIEAANRQKPVVLINRSVAGVANVLPDIVPGIEAAVAKLVALGHTKVAYLAGPKKSWMNSARQSAILAAANKSGLDVAIIGPNLPTLKAGGSALKTVLEAKVSAVITYNDLMAIGLLQSAQETGLSVPGKLGIIGFDNSFGTDFTSPRLSTIGLPLEEMGAAAVGALLAATSGKVTPAMQQEQQSKSVFIDRNSLGPAN